MSNYDSSDYASIFVVIVVVVVVVMIFFAFSTASHNPLHDFASSLVWMFMGWTSTKFEKFTYTIKI